MSKNKIIKIDDSELFFFLKIIVVLSNLESINAVLIHQGLSQSERIIQLNKIAITQMKSLMNSKQIKKLR